MAEAQSRRLRLWQGTVETDVEISGDGPPLVWLHGPWGLAPDRDFVARLAATRTVYAPHHPGTTKGDPDAVHRIDNWWDLMIYHAELFDALGLGAAEIAGHSYGGMLAAEIAATMPERAAKLVLIDPVGLWNDARPVRNWMILPDAERKSALFAAPEGEAASRFFRVPNDPEVRQETLTNLIWSQACTGKFVWPIPDRGMKKHLHRIATPTLIVWGDADGIIAPAYAEDFAAGIADSRIERIKAAGHMAHLEQPDAVAAAIAGFVGAGAKPARKRKKA